MIEQTPLSPPGVGTSAAEREEALKRRRARLLRSAGLDNSTKQQAEIDLDFKWWRAVRWTVETRWTRRVAAELCPDDNPWSAHPVFIDVPTEAVAIHACKMLKRRFPGKQYRYRPSRWVDAKGNRFPSVVPPVLHR